MRLLLITQDFPPDTGGIETYSFELARRFHRHAEQFAVIAPAKKDSAVDRELPYPVFRLPVRNSLLPLAAPVLVTYLSNRRHFDTVFHAQWQTAGASLLSRKLGYPRNIYVAAHARELLTAPFYDNGTRLNGMLNRVRKILFSRVTAFFPVSQYTAELLRMEGVPNEKIRVITNGTDPERFRPEEQPDLAKRLNAGNKPVVVTVCRLVRRKGIDLVLRALERLQKQGQDFVYIIGGSGPEEQNLKQLADTLGLTERVHFAGRIPGDQLAAYYNLADLFVMPARAEPPDVEGFGITFLEANACGVPVIGTKTGGIPDAVIDGKTGFLIEENNIDQLTSCMARLIEDPEMAERMGTNGRNRVIKQMTWDQVAEKLLENMERINRKSQR